MNNIATVADGKVLACTDIVLASRAIKYPGYKVLVHLVADIQSPIERIFRLQKFIDTPSQSEEHVKMAIQLIEDLQNGSIQLHSIH